MKSSVIITHCLVITILSAAGLCRSEAKSEIQSQTRLNKSQVERGQYLVHQVAMCIDCHSPRGTDGQFVQAKHLTGSLLAFAATIPMPWAAAAPSLAGLPPHYNRESMIHFLMTGERPGGLPPALPPMPTVRLSKQDAIAVTAYLESLKTD